MTTVAAHIRSLFLQPKDTYTPRNAATLLGMDLSDVLGWMEVGELEGVDSDDGVVLPWAELVSFGMGFWPQEAVEEALGAELAEVLPELLRLADLEVRIPRLEVVTLERLAARENSTVSVILARELRDLVSSHSEWLSLEVPGFAEALTWPDYGLVDTPSNPDVPAGSSTNPIGRVPREHDDDPTDNAQPNLDVSLFAFARPGPTGSAGEAAIH